MAKFSIGDKVVHKLFGNGTILDIDGWDDTTAKLTIEFKGKDSKMIIAKYIKPIKKKPIK